MNRILVTGAAGFIGSHLVEALLARGDQVVGLDNFDPFYSRATKERNLSVALRSSEFRFIEGSILDLERLGPLLTPETVVVHLAAKAGVRPSIADPRGYTETNVQGTAVVLEAIRQRGVHRLVLASSSSVYGNDTPSPFSESAPALRPVSPYAATKRAGELLVSAWADLHHLQVAALRYFTVYGPRQRPDLAIHSFARRILAGETITLFGDGSQSRDYTYCDDIVAGTVAAIDWTATAPPGVEVFNLGNNRPVALATLVAALSAELGVEPRVQWAAMQPGDVERTAADITKAGRMLGYHPQVTLAEGIHRFAAWCREEYAGQR